MFFLKSLKFMLATAISLVVVAGLALLAFMRTGENANASGLNGRRSSSDTPTRVWPNPAWVTPPAGATMQLRSPNEAAGWRIGQGATVFTVEFSVQDPTATSASYPVFPNTGIWKAYGSYGTVAVFSDGNLMRVEAEEGLGSIVTIWFTRSQTEVFSKVGAGEAIGAAVLTDPVYTGKWYAFAPWGEGATMEVNVRAADAEATGVKLSPIAGTGLSGYILTRTGQELPLVWDGTSLNLPPHVRFADVGTVVTVVVKATDPETEAFGLAVPVTVP